MKDYNNFLNRASSSDLKEALNKLNFLGRERCEYKFKDCTGQAEFKRTIIRGSYKDDKGFICSSCRSTIEKDKKETKINKNGA